MAIDAGLGPLEANVVTMRTKKSMEMGYTNAPSRFSQAVASQVPV